MVCILGVEHRSPKNFAGPSVFATAESRTHKVLSSVLSPEQVKTGWVFNLLARFFFFRVRSTDAYPSNRSRENGGWKKTQQGEAGAVAEGSL